MELKTSTVVAVLLACMMAAQCTAIPIASSDDETPLSTDKRPKYMDTRRELDPFKDLLLFALDELIDEGKINPNVYAEPESTEVDQKTKRAQRHLGLCLQVTSSGYRARPCWKNGGR